MKLVKHSTTCTCVASWTWKCASRWKSADVIHSDVLPNHCPPTKRKAQFTKQVSAFRFLAGMLFRTISLQLAPCLVLLFFELHDESSTAYRHSSRHALFKVLLVEFHYTCSHAFVPFPHLCCTRAGVAPLPGTIAITFSKACGRDSQDLCSFSFVLTTSRL